MNYLKKLIEVELEARDFGFDWPNFQMIIEQAIDECREIQEVIDLKESDERLLEEIGDLLHTAISMCVHKEINIDKIFKNVYEKFKKRIDTVKYLTTTKNYANLKNQSIDFKLDLWHEAKSINFLPQEPVVIRQMTSKDMQNIMEAFAKIGWNKPLKLFENYLYEQNLKERITKLAFYNNEFAGYVTLKWNSEYQYFARQNIPEIKDLNVLPQFRRNGIGAKLIDECEKIVSDNGNSEIGIGVGLYSDYGQAQRLYVRKGYQPDANGITYNGKLVDYGQSIMLDDDLNFWFTKKLKIIA